MKIVGIIPARYDSARFPGKPLVDMAGKPMIQRVYEQASKVALFQQVIVATDDERIEAAVKRFGGDVRMTARTHQSGTDRLAEVARQLDADILVNVQGDEPFIAPEMIEQAIRPLLDDPAVAIGTLKHRIKTLDELLNPNVVKVIATPTGRAIYFSRSPIPYIKGKEMRQDGFAAFAFYRHIGLYAYRRDFLLTFAALPQTPLEVAEGLEQLRALEHGYVIHVVETHHESLGVDTPEDMERALAVLRGS